MRTFAACLAVAALVRAHGGHGHGDEAPFQLPDDASYIEKHMASEHHIDSFDLPAFFKLHDLDNDGYWTRDEIAAVYGLHHHSVRAKLPDEQLRDGRTDVVVTKVLAVLDANKDGKVSLAEFVAGGKDGLPSFVGMAGLGHHYDEESEYFLHHEEMYHSTPETQTDESYTHPEGRPVLLANPTGQADEQTSSISNHIEEEEDARERLFEGLAPDADLSKDHVAADPLDAHAHAPGEGPELTPEEAAAAASVAAAEATLQPGDEAPAPPPRIERAMPGAQPNRIQRGGGARRESPGAGSGDGAHDHEHGRPRSAEDRLKAGTPYKYK